MPVSDRAIEMSDAHLARQELLDAVTPDLKRTEMRAFGPDVMIAVYDRAGKKTVGGVFLPETVREDEYQGIIGLILDMGPLASEEDPNFKRWFGGKPPKVGDWIGFRVIDGTRTKLGKNMIRFIEWKLLRFPTLVPDLTV